MSLVQKIGICAGLVILLFFGAEILPLPQWARLLCYYGILAVVGFGLWMVFKSSSSVEPGEKK